jgi:hypothetical protein
MVIERSDALGDSVDEGRGEDEVGGEEVFGYVKQSLRCRTAAAVLL